MGRKETLESLAALMSFAALIVQAIRKLIYRRRLNRIFSLLGRISEQVAQLTGEFEDLVAARNATIRMRPQ